ncbi:N-acetylmuramoyl-L-alanine amidase [Paenibacillus sp. p3-SID867]|uniref:N-acetylmuramoyl-L-alanine amidase family protein n=1 Tax=Paenibacillus sp. p3-SID867 TaxID=2916363 RepID=UPI0021A8233E|nr:N-acetylmuramoyl-L-alanine amidase [Paenibacillus sp. p3-SID867]MCT1401279.1 N-acetylmuramoyl-L-alanine amidase [Paenibacillus sp. p3-SID867]
MRKGSSIIITLMSALVIVLLYPLASGEGTASDRKAGMDVRSDKIRTLEYQSETPYQVVIDSGHGGKDNGATGASGSFEKDFTLQLALKVEELAKQEPGIEVVLTRSEDRFISSIDRERPEIANRLGADLFISIHGNTYEDASVSGTETYYYHENSRFLAEIMQKHMVQTSGFRDRGVKKEDFFVLKDSNMPAALIEMGYLTNPQEENEMLTEDYQYRMASSILDGIKEALNLN